MTDQDIITRFNKLSATVDRPHLIAFLANRAGKTSEYVGAVLKEEGL